MSNKEDRERLLIRAISKLLPPLSEQEWEKEGKIIAQEMKKEAEKQLDIEARGA